MKKLILLVLPAVAGVLLITAFTNPAIMKKNTTNSPQQEQVKPDFPENVAKILQTSCYDCHSSNSSNLKAKSTLNFTNWSEYTDSKKVGKMGAMHDKITEDKMPPSRYLGQNPDKALTQQQKDEVVKWIDEESKILMEKEGK